MIEQDGKDQNPHLTKYKDANDKYLGDDDKGYGKEWNDKYKLDLIGREYCRDRSIACSEQEFKILVAWKQAKGQFIMAHYKWIKSVLDADESLLKMLSKDINILMRRLSLQMKVDFQ